MKDIRYPAKNSINYEEYLNEIKKFLISISKDIRNLGIRFFPHIWSDINIIGDLLSILPDEIRREKTIVSELCCFKKMKIQFLRITLNATIYELHDFIQI